MIKRALQISIILSLLLGGCASTVKNVGGLDKKLDVQKINEEEILKYTHQKIMAIVGIIPICNSVELDRECRYEIYNDLDFAINRILYSNTITYIDIINSINIFRDKLFKAKYTKLYDIFNKLVKEFKLEYMPKNPNREIGVFYRKYLITILTVINMKLQQCAKDSSI